MQQYWQDTVHGTIAGSAAAPMTWNASGEQATDMAVFTCTASAATVLHVREAKTLAELDAAPETDLFHEFTKACGAGVTERLVIPRDPSLPFGRAWVATGSGNYVLNSSRFKA